MYSKPFPLFSITWNSKKKCGITIFLVKIIDYYMFYKHCHICKASNNSAYTKKNIDITINYQRQRDKNWGKSVCLCCNGRKHTCIPQFIRKEVYSYDSIFPTKMCIKSALISYLHWKSAHQALYMEIYALVLMLLTKLS